MVITMKKILAVIIALVLSLSFSACSGKGNEKAPDSSSTSVVGEVITAEIPDEWGLVTSTEMTGTGGADFICHSKKYELGDPYLQITKDNRDIAAVQTVLESEKTFGTYTGTSELGGATWYIAENAAATLIDGKVCLVRGYECDFGSDEVHAILGSLRWAE